MATTTVDTKFETLSLEPSTVGSSHSPVQAQAPSPLTPAQIAIVKATVPVLQQHGETITTLFYKNLLEAHPELRGIFNATAQSTGRQPRALAAAVLAYATHIDNLPALSRAVERIAHKHASLGVQPGQYAVVGEHLMGAIGAVLGDAATPEIVDAWTTAYGVLAAVFVGREKQLYQAHADWVGWRKFRIARKAVEAEGIASFYLEPADGVPLPTYLPGQYISLQTFVPQLGHVQSRQYSLSQAPRREGDYYRISVRKNNGEAAGVPGLISNALHDDLAVGDVVELTHPQGEFLVDPADRSREGVPMVLMSAGVGATPILAILDSATGDAPDTVRRPISWLHASRSRAVQPFATAVRAIQRANADRMSSHVFLKTVGPDDRQGVDYDFGGTRMDLGQVDRDKHLFVGDARAEYFLCGPEAFMVDMRQALEEMGVARERVFLELFATGDAA